MKPCSVRERKTRGRRSRGRTPTREGVESPPSRVVGLITLLLVLSEDRLDALDHLVGGLVGRPLVRDDPRDRLGVGELVVDLRQRRMLVVLEHLVVALEEDLRGHRDMRVLLPLRSLVTFLPERI